MPSPAKLEYRARRIPWGMIFIYPNEQPLSFWMRNTYIPLDMVFVSADGVVVGVVENAEPLTTTSQAVEGSSRFVVEFNAGKAAELGIRAGVRCELLNFPPGLLDSAREITGSVPSEAGMMAVEIMVTIGNGLDEALHIGYPSFRIQAAGLEYTASLDNESWDGVCSTTALLSSGATTSCAIIFVYPETANATGLVLVIPGGTAETTLEVVPCTRCGGACVDLMSSPTNCGVCDREVSIGGLCIDGVPTCPEGRYDCEGYCNLETAHCYPTSEVRTSCSALCAPLQCDYVVYYYDCGDGTSESAAGLGCSDTPPVSFG